MDTLREAPFGQLVRWVTRDRIFRYPDERSDFVLPPIPHKSDIPTPVEKPHSAPDSSEENEEKPGDHAARRPDQAVYTSESGSVVPQQKSKDKFLVDWYHSKDDILVDWYHSGDDANPQNWSSLKKALVTFQLW